MRDVTDGSGVKVALLYTNANANRPDPQHTTDTQGEPCDQIYASGKQSVCVCVCALVLLMIYSC